MSVDILPPQVFPITPTNAKPAYLLIVMERYDELLREGWSLSRNATDENAARRTYVARATSYCERTIGYMLEWVELDDPDTRESLVILESARQREEARGIALPALKPRMRNLKNEKLKREARAQEAAKPAPNVTPAEDFMAKQMAWANSL